ncbi:PHD and RING finger domain-containing protein 1-like [Myxocyprinus asiaticus]|uniref:PHD and RING finger domain-containing protein 1-like n=1 Tax=Myxocyprinus asiaticus TaxID=70543 RepID=UPI0022233818|nr:PHD and RING finger domain-containing protein 1-like [Myxocyprinus asiaticus]
MDEEDSQDELINRNVSHGKGKRPAMSIISDDEDISEDGGQSEEVETDSEEDDDEDGEEEEEVLNGEDEEDEEEDESENEDSGKVLEGAVENVLADAAGLSSDEDSEKCPICLNSFHEQPVATPEACEHYFCLDCILEWSKNANSCPVDRIVFKRILLRKCYGGKIQKTIAVQKPLKPGQEEQVELYLDQTSCEVCRGRDREDHLLLCDGCDAGYHMECLTPPLDAVPVEEWFCPECIANNRSSGSDQISEEESSLPTTSRSQTRATRAIARTQQSERVRANVNRHRITQARTAAQLTPRNLMQSTWLDETINAVVAGLNTAVYVRDFTHRSRSRRRRKTVKRRKTKSKSSGVSGGKANMGVKRRKRRLRKSKSRRKLVVRKETNSRSRIAQSLGIKKPKPGSIIPSVYRPSEYSLGSMRAEIGAAPLSVYGDPFDLDPFDDREEEIQAPTPYSVLDAKRRGLSRSAMRSHQPVARPIPAGLSRRGTSIPHVEEVAAEAPLSDLLGSILSGQNMLLMDSSDVVINRDGSLKATKPVCLSLLRSTTSRRSGSGDTGNSPNSETSFISPTELAGPSSSPLWRPPSAHSSPGSCPTPQNPMSPCPPINSPHLPYSHPSPMGQSPLHLGGPHRAIVLNPPRPVNGPLNTNEIRGQLNSVVSSNPSDSHYQDKDSTARQSPVKKPPPKPVWVDVSVLPRIPKIKREGTASANSSSCLPGSSVTSLAGNLERERTVDQQGTSQQSREMDAQRQRPERTGASSTFSSSFTSTTSSFGASSNSRPSSSSVSFRISSSGNPWHARRLTASGGTLPANDEESIKRNKKSKQMLLSLRTQDKKVKSEVYDPFNPTGSDSSDDETENEGPDVRTHNTDSRVPVGPNEDGCHQIKSEPMNVDTSDTERGSEMSAEVKPDPESFRDKLWTQEVHNSDAVPLQTPSNLAVDCSRSEAVMKTEEGGTPESLSWKIQENSVSSLSCNDQNIKMEVMSEPEDRPPPVRRQSKSLEESVVNLKQDSQGNGVCEELPSSSGSFNATHMAKVMKERPCQSKDRKRSPSNSQSPPPKDSHKKKPSSSKDKRSRSKSRDRRRSRSKEKQRFRSRSKERRRPRSRDRRCSSSSSSRERKTSGKRTSREKNDNRGRERQRKRSKEKRRSRSRSFSRSIEKRKVSKDQGEARSKRQKSRSRSTTRDRKRQEARLESSRRTGKPLCETGEPTSAELNEPALSANKTSTPLMTEKYGTHEAETVSLSLFKQEMHSVGITTHVLGSRSGDLTRTLKGSKEDIALEVSNEPHTYKPKEFKKVEPWPIGAVKELKDIKKEEPCLNLCEELDGVKDTKENISLDFFKGSPKQNEMELHSAGLEKSQAGFQDDKIKAKEMVVEPKQIKIEQIWPDEDDSPCCSDNTLLINLDTPDIDSENCKKETTEIYRSPLMTENIEMAPVQPPGPIKQEVNSSDEDISVDYLIDNLDFIKKEMSESSVTDSTDAVDPKSAIEEAQSGNKTSEAVIVGAKSKLQGKRVTWNLQEPEEPQSEKLSKLALFKLKLKQEGSRRSTTCPQTFNQDKASTQAESKLTATVPSPPSLDSCRPKSQKQEVVQDPNQKEKYMKKLHMQERAIEEVKLAIKPFYKKREITKEEYKEILRKAVQKVCHSKSGEINPVKVANLVKAYVDKYKHARKHRKEETVQNQNTDAPKDFQTSV